MRNRGGDSEQSSCAKACIETKDFSLTMMIVSAFLKTSIFEVAHDSCD